MNRFTRRIILLAALWLAPFAPDTALSQGVHILEVREGAVYLNGRVVPEEALPSTWNTAEIGEARVTATGSIDPVIAVGGRLYTFDGNGIREVAAPPVSTSYSIRFNTVFSGIPGGEMDQSPSDWLQSIRLMPPAFDLSAFDGAGAPLEAPLPAGPQARLLQQQATEFMQRSNELARFGAEHSARQLRESAQEMFEAARELPRLEYDRYLTDVRQENQELWQNLMREADLERQSREVAVRLRALPADSAVLKTRLHLLLNQAFDLKQQNRRREISRLEEQLLDLQRRLEERERNRNRIIDLRATELLGR